MTARAALVLLLLLPLGALAGCSAAAPPTPAPAPAPGPESEPEPGGIDVAVVALPAPPFPAAASGVPESALRELSARPNEITDTEAWFERTGVRLPTYIVPQPGGPDGGPGGGAAGELPAGIPLGLPDLDLRLVRAVRGDGVVLLLYGSDSGGARVVVGWDPEAGRALYAYDFARYEETPGWTSEFADVRLLWALQRGRTLYVSHAHPTYSRDTGGRNGYLTAIDLDSGRLRWRSPALVANAATFVLQGGLILAGYGFTAEPDYVYLLDPETGEVRGRHKVKSAPEIVAVHEGKLHVRCYDTDYVFELPAAAR